MSTLVERFTAAFGARYEVERELGTGATATVFLANDVRYQRRVAVKLFRPEVAEVMGHERFAREIALVAKLNHPHIVPLLDSGEVDGMMFYVMPAVDGETLRERMTRESTLPVDEAIRISHDVAVALDYAHLQGVVHRDIKPENILLTAGTAVVTDFGIAKMLNAGTGGTSLTRAGMAVGTVTYMSPEQASAGEVDGRADVYSLGCVLFEMLAGRPPFVGTTTRSVVVSHFTDPVPSLHRLRAEVAPSVEMAICKALAKNPVERFATATDFMRELAKARRAASRERMWMQLGGTTPPPKSGEWHRKDVPPEFASPPAATPGRVAAPTPSAAAQPHRPVTPMGVPASPPVADRADPVAHGSHTGVGATTGEGAAGGTGSTRWILAAGVVIVAGALAWFLLR